MNQTQRQQDDRCNLAGSATMKPMRRKFLVLFGLIWCCLALFGPNFFMFFRGAVEPAWETSELSRRPEARAFHGKNLETPCVVSYGLRVNWKKYSGVLLEKCDGIPRGTALLLGAQKC